MKLRASSNLAASVACLSLRICFPLPSLGHQPSQILVAALKIAHTGEQCVSRLQVSPSLSPRLPQFPESFALRRAVHIAPDELGFVQLGWLRHHNSVSASQRLTL